MSGLFGGGSAPSTSTTANRVSAMQIQTSNYGKALQIVYGTTRVSPNLIYYTDFQAIPHTTTTSSGGGGGKGGGGGGSTSSNTTFTYKASVIMALGEGQTNNIGTIWRSKEQFTSLASIGMDKVTGAVGQTPLSYLTGSHPSEALGYSGISYVYGWGIDLDTSAAMFNYSFELVGQFVYQFNGGTSSSPLANDANPKDIIFDLLTNAQYGCGFKSSDFGDLSSFANYCLAAGIYISPCYDTQKSGADAVNELALITNSAPVYSDGLLKIIPYQDSSLSGNGATYSPNITPVYDLNDDDFLIKSQGDDPVKITRKTVADAFNQVQVEFMNRSNDYNVDIATAKDQASIESSGFRPQTVTQLHAICDPAIAQKVANNILQRVLYIRNTYEFTLGWRYGRLEPMDIVTISDDTLGFSRVPVRITEVQEDEEGNLAIVAEECNFGTASSSLYPHQDNSGFAHNYQISPGNVSAPSFFEPPVDLTTTGLEVWAAMTGVSQYWGGCSIWVSLDGSTYKKQGQIFGGARYGTLTAALNSSNSLSVALAGTGGQLLSGTSQDASTLQTLCMVTDGVNTEYLSYQTATLTSANHYTLTGLVRSAYGTYAYNKPATTRFVRIDDAIAKSGALDLSLVGKSVYFKFTSFNIYGGGEQSLADVSAYSYQITGELLKLPPSDVTGISIAPSNNGSLITWNADPQPDWAYTEIRLGTDWSTATLITKKQATSHLLGWLTSGTTTVLAKHVDIYGNYSVNPVSASIVTSVPNSVIITRAEVQENSVALGWNDSKLNQPIVSYAMYIGSAGDAFSASTLYGKAGADSRSDIVIFRSSGSKVIWMVATDVAGNVSIPSYVNVSVTLPTNFVLANEYDENWSTGTITNGYVDSGSLYLPVNPQTWANHFSTRGYATAQDQINAGYPLYFEPSEAAGSYYEYHDIGKIITSATISITPVYTVLSGSLTSTCFIEWSSNGTTWVNGGDNLLQVQATSLRYVRLTYTVTSDGGDDLIRFDRIHVVVGTATVNEFGALTLSASDVSGTPYTCNKSFLDIISAVATANNSSNIKTINTIISDGVSPQIVYVQAWDSSNNRTSGTVSLNIGGY